MFLEAPTEEGCCYFLGKNFYFLNRFKFNLIQNSNFRKSPLSLIHSRFQLTLSFGKKHPVSGCFVWNLLKNFFYFNYNFCIKLNYFFNNVPLNFDIIFLIGIVAIDALLVDLLDGIQTEIIITTTKIIEIFSITIKIIIIIIIIQIKALIIFIIICNIVVDVYVIVCQIQFWVQISFISWNS